MNTTIRGITKDGTKYSGNDDKLFDEQSEYLYQISISIVIKRLTRSKDIRKTK